MRRVSLAVICLTLAQGANACPSFGFETDYLSEFFCREFGAIAGPTTRNMGTDTTGVAPDHPFPDWMVLEPVAEAWRVDPASTLELIERIRAAGGRPHN